VVSRVDSGRIIAVRRQSYSSSWSTGPYLRRKMFSMFIGLPSALTEPSRDEGKNHGER
jgi:hypothetical protein